jgi:hypothetical protein
MKRGVCALTPPDEVHNVVDLRGHLAYRESYREDISAKWIFDVEIEKRRLCPAPSLRHGARALA